MPRDYRIEREDELYAYIKGLSQNKKDNFFKVNIEKISKHLFLTCIIEGFLTDENLISSRKDEITMIMESKFRGIGQELPDFLNQQLEKLAEKITDYSLTPAIKSIMAPMLFKKLLYDKDPQAKQVADESIYLSSSIEYFVLANLFPLIEANNTTDIAFNVFMHHLWDALKNEIIDISDHDLLNLFPSCSTMGYDDLSCEAFYWEKQKEFLCRGKICSDPRILPDINKNYYDYNIYDWFKHYGVDYINEGNPSKKDFPIKLAGYFNRLKEIFDIIKCRECYSLMLPDMRYARVEYYDYDFDKKKYVKKNTAAAYRVTVFKCGNAECSLFETKYYINHCLGFGCYSIIDSRDLKLKCGDGLYICRGCGSCCEQCAKEHPNGFCPDCGNNLILYEKNKNRFVYCSIRDCGFKISEHKLPKKFLLPSQPVKRINGNSDDRNNYSNYSTYDEEDLPF
jgi:DNA-directed RNA polymerase subunit M/transcription elongation factor TFIIS